MIADYNEADQYLRLAASCHPEAAHQQGSHDGKTHDEKECRSLVVIDQTKVTESALEPRPRVAERFAQEREVGRLGRCRLT